MVGSLRHSDMLVVWAGSHRASRPLALTNRRDDDVTGRQYGVAMANDDIRGTQSEPVQRPAAVLLAGPNGAGKTTASSLLLGSSVPFLNADLIAADLRRSGHSGTAVDVAAGRQLLAELDARVSGRQSFCVETNLAGRGWIHHIEEWRDVGYHVTLQFLALVDADTAVARVAQRVAQGGHGVPEEVIRRRYNAGLRQLFATYMALADSWTLYDNSTAGPPTILARGPNPLVIHEAEAWAHLTRSVGLSRSVEPPKSRRSNGPDLGL